MNKKAYEKLIRGVILPQFPFILGFEIIRGNYVDKIGFRVEYIVNLNNVKEGEKKSLYDKLNDQTNDMFKLIGFPPHVVYIPIRIDPI